MRRKYVRHNVTRRIDGTVANIVTSGYAINNLFSTYKDADNRWHVIHNPTGYSAFGDFRTRRMANRIGLLLTRQFPYLADVKGKDATGNPKMKKYLHWLTRKIDGIRNN